MHNQLFLVACKNNKYDNSSYKSVSIINYYYYVCTVIPDTIVYF